MIRQITLVYKTYDHNMHSLRIESIYDIFLKVIQHKLFDDDIVDYLLL